MSIKIGTCSWTDRVREPAGKLYHTARPTAEQMLGYYASMFPTVEVDATFYALPSLKTCESWAKRTPEGFKFHIKAFSHFTTHRTNKQRLPADLKRDLPRAVDGKTNLNFADVPQTMRNELWRRFREALTPLKEADKLGFIVLQFAPWFKPTRQNADYILECKQQLEGLDVAVEFRNESWFQDKLLERTPAFLGEHGLAMVCVDMPQGLSMSIPPLALATARNSYVRLHGRNTETWELGGAPVNNLHDYWYTEEELTEWLERARELEEQSGTVYFMLNTVQGFETAQAFQEMVKDT